VACGCMKKNTPGASQRLVASAPPPARVGPWKVTYTNGSTETFPTLLPAQRAVRRRGGRIDAA